VPLSQPAKAHRLLEEQKVVGAVVVDPKGYPCGGWHRPDDHSESWICRAKKGVEA